MHIAFLTPEYPHAKVKHAAGLGTSIGNLVSALVRQGVSVTVIVYGQEKSEIFTENGITFHLIGDKKYRFGKWYFYRKHIQKYCNRIIKEEKIDVLEAPDWTGITAFMNFRIPLVIRFHGSDTYFCHLEKRKQKLKNFWFEKLAVQKAQGYIAPTAFAGKLSAALFGIQPEKIKTIHHGLKLDQFENDSPNQFEKGLIVYIGTIIRKKGVLELPAIFHKVRVKCPNARLVLIGSDSSDIATGKTSTWELLQQKITPNDMPSVAYLGKIPYSEVKNYIQKAHLCVFPTFAETLGMVTIESMAMQKPVVNSNMGWAQELMVDGVSGYLVDPKNHEESAQKMIQILSSEKLASKMGVAARKQVQNKFDINVIVKENMDYYETIISN
ncbi:glycosyltransferase family 1 protein [Flavobacterium rhamnosiphilum]|uniref:Glycosyltransferase family 1 protein n=1 Tax=Flavobacterium rhamnosiphilum TaxID=2541724 RepID=A0A4R5FC55_9FLAO|nr:glycosyltransferase family 4 protein [Flavobacterium rhamnosiphilum]TDE46034.1 glycosyltransferase family 1 protein [Flavobacterium rhamnosiphilum]